MERGDGQTSIGNLSCDLEEEVIPRVPPWRPRAIGRSHCDAIASKVNQEDGWSKESETREDCMHRRDSCDAMLVLSWQTR